jgi:lysine-N-methylase
MKLPLLIPDIKQQRFTCQGCTNCCRELVVHLTPADRSRIDAQAWGDRLGSAPYVRLGNNFVLNHAPGGGCVFLQSDGKCRIHVEHGGREKPLACQLYPFTLDAGGGAIRASIRFDCPTVIRSAGETFNRHAGELNRIAAELQQTAPQVFAGSEDRYFLTTGRACAEEEVAALVDSIDDWLADMNVPLMMRLAGLCSVLETLQSAQLQKLDTGRFIELVRMLFAEMGNGGHEDRDAPTSRQERLLLQAVFAHCEQIDLEQARRGILDSWRYRWGQLRRARQLTSGAAPIPMLIPGTREVPYDAPTQVRPDPEHGPETSEILTRYLRAKILTRGAFGPGYYGWPVLDGVSAMVLSVAVIGWLARYLAATSRQAMFGTAEIRRAIAIVDRAAGRVPELGSRSGRLRLNLLCRDHGLMRLVQRYTPCAMPSQN